jgi:hypothetical protein
VYPIVERACSIEYHRRSLSLTPEKIPNGTPSVSRLPHRLHPGDGPIVLLAPPLVVAVLDAALRVTVRVVVVAVADRADPERVELPRVVVGLDVVPAEVLAEGLRRPVERVRADRIGVVERHTVAGVVDVGTEILLVQPHDVVRGGEHDRFEFVLPRSLQRVV